MNTGYLWLGCKAKEKSSGKIGRVVSEPSQDGAHFVLSNAVYSVAFDGGNEVRRLGRRQVEFMPE